MRTAHSVRQPAAQQTERRSPLYLVTGLILGLITGLFLAWGVFPAAVVDAAPSNLAQQYRQEYRTVVAMAYASSGDLGRAHARLLLLGDGDPVRTLNAQAQLALLSQNSQREARALASLAAELEPYLASLASELPQELLATTLPYSEYSLTSQQQVCAGREVPLLQLTIRDADGGETDGLRLTLISESGQQETFTGLFPEVGAGYAFFELQPGEDHTLAIEDVELLSGIQAAACEQGDQSPWGDWVMVFEGR